MSQRQFITYQSDILSFEAMEALMGVLSPGRYSGYNVLAPNGSPAGGSIPLKLQHTGGIQKLAKGATSLSPAIGVMVTTQGTIIHEDQEVTITITNNAGGAGIKYCVVYMEHLYLDGVAGGNPAIYGVVNGVQGGDIPVVTNVYKRSVVGVIEIAAGGTTITDCTWYPRASDNIFGDTQLLQKLFGATYNYLTLKAGEVPVDGVIGNREYSEEFAIESKESITSSLQKIDLTLRDISLIMEGIGNRSLDDVNWGSMTDVTHWNANSSRHGFLPKLPNDPEYILNGLGQWVKAPGTLLAANNLSDLANAATARQNLGVLSAQEIQNTYFYDSGWVDMTPGVAVNVSDYSLKIRRLGKLCVVSGQFTGGANMDPNSIIASVLYTSINPADTYMKPLVRAYFGSAAAIDDRRLTGYVQAFVSGDTSLFLKIHVKPGGSPDSDYVVNFSFYVD